MHRLKTFGVRLSKRLNVLLGGHPKMTFSARCYLKAASGNWFWVMLRNGIDLVFFFDPEHCRSAFMNGE